MLVAAQLVPVARDNPPVTQTMPAPPEVLRVLRRSCFDCHSNETRWPWYAHVAPVSWLVAHDVAEGREHLNFSRWDVYAPRKRAKLLDEMHDAVTEGWMPLGQYLLVHRDAVLSPEEVPTVATWAEGTASQADEE
jgi:hypothetical protein